MYAAIEQDLIDQLGELGHRVRNTREFRSLTQPQVAKLAGVGLQTYLRIEDGHAGIGAVNLGKVLRVLGMEESLMPSTMPPEADAALHERHRDSTDVDQAIEDAVTAACESLDAFFDVKHPEVDGIGSNFQGLLKEHVAAMLCGAHGAKQRYATFLPRLLYSDAFVGGPSYTESKNHGWVLRVRGTNRVLNELSLVPVTHASLDPFSSREYALEGFRKFIEKAGHPPGPVDAVPVYLHDDEKYSFVAPVRARAPILTERDHENLGALIGHVIETVRASAPILGASDVTLGVAVLSHLFAAIDSSNIVGTRRWLEEGRKVLASGQWEPSASVAHGPLTRVDYANLDSFLGYAMNGVRTNALPSDAVANAIWKLFTALDGGDLAEVQSWLKRGRKMLDAVDGQTNVARDQEAI